jgi:hypothetical protein
MPLRCPTIPRIRLIEKPIFTESLKKLPEFYRKEKLITVFRRTNHSCISCIIGIQAMSP